MLTFLVVALRPAWPQTDSGEPSFPNEAQSPAQLAPNPDATPQPTETSPMPGLNQSTPGSAGPAAPNYLEVAVHVSGGSGTDAYGASGGSSQFSPVGSVLGSLNLAKLRRRSETAIDYAGGVTFDSGYNHSGWDAQQLQQLDASHRILWRKAQLTFTDSLSDIHGGNFGLSSFGGASAYNLRFSGDGSRAPADPDPEPHAGAVQVGLNRETYITNVSAVELAWSLAPRSSIFLSGAYLFTDYLGSSQSLINGRQISTQAGYKYQLNSKDSVGLVYGYQTFRFSMTTAGAVITNSVQLVYRRRISGRMNLVLGAGPEMTNVNGGIAGKTQQVNTAARAALGYLFPRSSLTLSYSRGATTGYGLFAGGSSNTAQFSVNRAVSRLWQANMSAGYAAVSSLQPATDGISGDSYNYAFVGMAVQRRLRHHLNAFASYQLNDESSFCGGAAGCAPRAVQHLVQIGIDWSFRPIRLE